MISERKFSNSYTSFWNQLLPTADLFLKKLNLTSGRYCLPTDSIILDRNKRAIINELAFRIFNKRIKKEKFFLEILIRSVISYIKRLAPYETNIVSLSEEEIAEAKEISQGLSIYFNSVEKVEDSAEVIIWPSFKGCGQLDECKGDIIYNNQLIEVKAGDRHFKIIDIRQIITYLALNFNSKQFELNQIALVNPRTGLYFNCSVNDLIESTSGKKPVDIFSEIIYFLSAEIGSI